MSIDFLHLAATNTAAVADPHTLTPHSEPVSCPKRHPNSLAHSARLAHTHPLPHPPGIPHGHPDSRASHPLAHAV